MKHLNKKEVAEAFKAINLLYDLKLIDHIIYQVLYDKIEECKGVNKNEN